MHPLKNIFDMCDHSITHNLLELENLQALMISHIMWIMNMGYSIIMGMHNPVSF